MKLANHSCAPLSVTVSCSYSCLTVLKSDDDMPHLSPPPNELLAVRSHILFIYVCLVHGLKIYGHMPPRFNSASVADSTSQSWYFFSRNQGIATWYFWTPCFSQLLTTNSLWLTHWFQLPCYPWPRRTPGSE